ncbi:uncharacterized protein METZ01_LOCUS344716, partial [marine metagenome]
KPIHGNNYGEEWIRSIESFLWRRVIQTDYGVLSVDERSVGKFE